MFTLYTVLLTLHIASVVSWVGVGLAQVVLSIRAQASAKDTGFYFEQLDWFGRKWFPPITGFTALTGILLWIDGPWEFGEPWVIIALVGWIISAVIGATQLGPRAQKLLAGGGSIDDPVFAEFRTLVRVDQTLLFLIIADMVLKPGL